MFRGGKARRHLMGTPVRLFSYVTPTLSMRPACSVFLPPLRLAPHSELSQEGPPSGLWGPPRSSKVVPSPTQIIVSINEEASYDFP